jgi:PAS domain S-box-containing protein
MSRWLARPSVRMIVLALVVVVPSLAVTLYEQASDLRRDREQEIEHALRLAHLAADKQGAIFGGVQRLLGTLALFPALQDGSPAACNAVLPAVLRAHPAYINIFIVRADGTPFCLARPLPSSVSWTSSASSAWFTRATASRTFAFGDHQVSRTTGVQAVVLAQPIVGRSGQVERVIAASIGLDQLNAIFSGTTLPSAATLTLIDRSGTVLARTSDAAAWIGRQHPQLESVRQSAAEHAGGMRESTGSDGVTRLFAVVPVAGDSDSGLFVTFDIESSALFPDAGRRLAGHAGLFGLVMLWSIGVGLLGRRTVVRPIEHARVEAEDRMRFALEASRVGIWEFDLKANVVYWSAITEAMHGLAPGRFGRTLDAFVDCIHPDDRTQVLEAIALAIADHRGLDLQYRTVWPNGTEHHVSATCQYFYDDSGAPLRGAGVVIDCTEKRSLEDQLRQSQKMEAVGQLAGGIAHDFNNMLLAILGNADFLMEALPAGDARRADLDEIIKAGRRAQALTRQLLVFSRKQIVEHKVLHVGDVVTGLAPMLRTLLGEAIELRTVTSDRARVKADAGGIEQVLMNLAVNARDAMGPKGRLTIETSDVDLDAAHLRLRPGLTPGRYVMVAVSDTGCGIDPVTKKRLFEPFFTTKPAGQGTGLGLATVYGIVKQCGGHVTVDSEPGQGATFLVYLPETAEAPGAAHVASERHAISARGHERVLVVEDEGIVSDLVTKALTRQGYEVHAVCSPAAAIDFATAHPAIDLILTDVVLPDMSGPAMIAELKAHDVSPAVVYMSGFTGEALAQRDLLASGTSFLQKPFTGRALAATVRQALDMAASTPRAVSI